MLRPAVFFLLLLTFDSARAGGEAVEKSVHYPPARKGNQIDDYHGTKVADPYRWLENPDSPESRKWIEAENELTFKFLDTIPARAAIRARLKTLWDYEKFGVPEKEQSRFFFTKNSGMQNQSVVYTTDDPSKPAQELLDPNKLSKDGTVALGGSAVSDDAKFFAYGLATAGSDWQEWKVRDIATNKDASDDLKWVKFSGAAWKKDSSGFFYSRYDEPKGESKLRAQVFNPKIYFHTLGTPQSQDQLVYERPDHKDWLFSEQVTEDGRYLIVEVNQGTSRKNRVFCQDLSQPDAKVVELLPNGDAAWHFIGNDGATFWFRTDQNASLGRIVAIDTTQSAPAQPNELVPESGDKLENVSLIGEHFVAVYLQDAHAAVKLFKLDGSPDGEIALPGLGTVEGFTGKRADRQTFFSFTSFTTPPAIYRYDFDAGKSVPLFVPKLKFSPNDYTTAQVFFTSADGTKVPMFISSKKGLKKNGENPTYLYGYGGFDISVTPTFSPPSIVWMEMGGVYAVANLRGGGEYGEKWHEAGMKHAKQNVFDDFVAAAQYLIDNNYTSTPKLAIGGASNGGLLVGACLTQRPDLFGAAVPAVGVMDMLRFQKFTIGWAWTSDYGNSDSADDFPYLYAYSPLQHIASGATYPATFITTADHDDRVVPAHSFKFAATLQADQAGSAPILIRIETKAGHGAGKPTSKIIDEIGDRWAFLAKELHMTLPATLKDQPDKPRD